MLQSAMGYLTGADATAMAAETQAHCLQVLEQVTSMGTAARTSILAAHLRPGVLRRRGLQPAGLADQSDTDHQRRRDRVHLVGQARRGASPGRAGAGVRGDVGVGGADDLPVDR